MKAQSLKAKGRRLQQKIVEDLYAKFPQLQEGDLRSTAMGHSGEDVLMSPRARELVPFSIEAKNQERINVWECFSQCVSNAREHSPALVIKRNRSDMLCVIRWETFLNLLNLHAASNTESVPEQLRRIADQLETSPSVSVSK